MRFEVERWRARGYPGATPITRKLVQHWSAKPPERDEPALFCQREAAETAIFLAEVAGRHGYADYRTRIDPENATHNDGLNDVVVVAQPAPEASVPVVTDAGDIGSADRLAGCDDVGAQGVRDVIARHQEQGTAVTTRHHTEPPVSSSNAVGSMTPESGWTAIITFFSNPCQHSGVSTCTLCWRRFGRR